MGTMNTRSAPASPLDPTACSVPGYRTVRELGRGASGHVVLAVHVSTGTAVAVKYLSPALLAADGFVEEFRGEARLLGEVADPHVARLWEYVEGPGGAAIVMELVDGVTLRAVLGEHGATDPEPALVVLKGSLLGLGAAHAGGVVHRDYKPENVMVTRDGTSVLTDFGVAARAGGTGATSGTASYMAPEQWRGGTVDRRTDLYAATATFVECLTGRPPYVDSDPAALRLQHEEAPIPVDHVPDPVSGLVRAGLAKEPAGRPSDVATFLAELETVATAAYGAGWEERGRRRLAERAVLLALLFPLATGAVGGTAVATTVLGRLTASRGIRVGAGAAAAFALVVGAGLGVSALSGGTTVAAAGDAVAPVVDSPSDGARPPALTGPVPSNQGTVLETRAAELSRLGPVRAAAGDPRPDRIATERTPTQSTDESADADTADEPSGSTARAGSTSERDAGEPTPDAGSGSGGGSTSPQPGDDDTDAPGDDDGNEPGDDDGNEPGDDEGNEPGDDDAEAPGDDEGGEPGDDDAEAPGDDNGAGGEPGADCGMSCQ